LAGHELGTEEECWAVHTPWQNKEDSLYKTHIYMHRPVERMNGSRPEMRSKESRWIWAVHRLDVGTGRLKL